MQQKDNITVKNLIILSLLCLIIGLILGYLLCYKTNIKTTPEQLEYVESIISEIDNLHPGLSNYTDISQLKEVYFMYNDVARFMLTNQIENICGVRGDYKYKTKQNIESEINMFCEEICD